MSLLSADKNKQHNEYKKFVLEDDSKEVSDFFSRKRMPPILGSKEFIELIKEKFCDMVFRDEIPEGKKLAPDMEKIKRVVCESYQLNEKELYGIKRGVVNEPRNIAVFLARELRGDSLKSIGKTFKINNYSSVSSIVEGMRGKIHKNKMLKQKIGQIIEKVRLSQRQT